MALGKAAAVGAGQQRVMAIFGRRQAEQRLEQAVDMGGGEQIHPAHDMGDALGGVVDGDGEMIAGGRVLAGEDDVARGGGIGADVAGMGIVPPKEFRPELVSGRGTIAQRWWRGRRGMRR